MGITKLLEERQSMPVDPTRGFVDTWNKNQDRKRASAEAMAKEKRDSDARIKEEQSKEYINVSDDRDTVINTPVENAMQQFTSMIGTEAGGATPQISRTPLETETQPSPEQPQERMTVGQNGVINRVSPEPVMPEQPSQESMPRLLATRSNAELEPSVNPITGQVATPKKKWISKTEYTQEQMNKRAAAINATKQKANQVAATLRRGGSGKSIMEQNQKQQEILQKEIEAQDGIIDKLLVSGKYMTKKNAKEPGTPENAALVAAQKKKILKENEKNNLQAVWNSMNKAGIMDLTEEQLKDYATSQALGETIAGSGNPALLEETEVNPFN